MFRFLVNKKENDYFILDDATLKHMKVSRINKEHFICIYQGKFFETILEGNLAKIVKELEEDHEFSSEVILAASVIKIKNFELVIKKAVELGVTKLVPMISHYTNVKFDQKVFDKKISRWNSIIETATKQSFRNNLMQISSPMKFEEVINNIKSENKYIAYVDQEQSDPGLFESPSLFIIGPEGGFHEDEIAQAKKKGIKVISLGKRILRAETASMYVLSRLKK